MKWKTKTGEKINAKEFIKRFKSGIQSITPLQKLENEQRATFIMLVGYVIGFISLIIYRELFVVQWFTYALMIIFAGAGYGQGIKLFALMTQLKLFRDMGNQSLDLDKVFENLEEKPLEEAKKINIEPLIRDEEQVILNEGTQKGMGDTAIKVEDYVNTDERRLKEK